MAPGGIVISTLLGWLSSGILDRLLVHAERRLESTAAKRRVEADLAAEEIRAEIKARADARAVLLAETGEFWAAARLGRLAFVLPLGFWWAAVCLDSVFRFGWAVAEVPVLREWGGIIITSLFLVDGARSISRAVVANRR